MDHIIDHPHLKKVYYLILSRNTVRAIIRMIMIDITLVDVNVPGDPTSRTGDLASN